MWGNYRYFKYFFAIAAILVFFLPSISTAEIGLNVYDESVYRSLDKLSAAGLIKTYNPYQRPLSSYTVAKLIIEAEENADFNYNLDLEWIIEGLKEKFGFEVGVVRGEQKRTTNFRPLDEIHLIWGATNQTEEPMPANGVGATSGRVQPLMAYKGGRHFNNYLNIYYDTVHSLELTPYFAAYLNPWFFYNSAAGEDYPTGGVKIARGYLKGGYRNVEFQVGRDEIRWGSGAYGSLLFTNNARGLDMIRFTTPSTWRLPWVLKYLGQWRTTAFFSWMGTKYHLPNAILSGYRIDYQPFYWLDIGFDHVVLMGGKGAKDPSIGTAIGEFIGFIFGSGNQRATSNHQMGLDLSVKIPPLSGVEIYGKVLFEDTNKENDLMYKHNASYMAGIYLPLVDSEGRLSFRGEFVRMGEYAYRHGQYWSGWAIDGKFIGYDAGSDTYSWFSSVHYTFNMDEFIDAGFRYLKRSSNVYSADSSKIVMTVPGTKEYHYLFKIGGQKRLNRLFNLYGEFGLDYTENKWFTQGKNALDFTAMLMITAHNF